MNPEDFYTRLGVVTKFALKDIDGKDSGQWLMVGGLESTAWRKSRQDRIQLRLAKSLAPEKDIEKNVEKDTDRETSDLLSKLVADWSFSETFTQNAVANLLYNTPYILDDLDTFVSNKSRFFKKK